MAHAFYGSRISANIARDNAGSLICYRVPLCRTGWQSYQGRELGLDTDEIVRVYRSAREVFDPATVASANGKFVCDGHPPRFLTPDNTLIYARGFCMNPREGSRTADGERTLIGELVVFDPSLISKVENRVVREISLGYDCGYLPREDGTIEQTAIRINHVAFVPTGRCGAACRVHDHDHDNKEQPMTKAEREQLAEAMELVREFTDAFRERQQALDCGTEDREAALEANDRAYGQDMKKLHRGGKTVVTKETLRQTAQDADDWATVMNAYGRLLRAGR